MSVQLYAKPKLNDTKTEIHELITDIARNSEEINTSIKSLLTQFKNLGVE